MEQKIFFFQSIQSTWGVKLPKHIHLVLSNTSSFLHLQLQKTVFNPCFKWPILHCTHSPGNKAVQEKQKISLQSRRWVMMSYLNINQLSHRWLSMFLPPFLSMINVRKVISHKNAGCILCAQTSSQGFSFFWLFHHYGWKNFTLQFLHKISAVLFSAV